MECHRAGFEARGFQQVANQPIQTIGFLFDRGQQLGAVLGGIGRVGLAQTGRAGLDRRQRRTEIVRDRAQEGGLHFIGAPRDGCLLLLLASAPRRAGQLGRDDGDEEQQDEADRFVGAGDGQRADWLDEEQIVPEHGEHAGQHGRPAAPPRRGQHDRQQVQQERRRQRRARLDQPDREQRRHSQAGRKVAT